MRIYYLNKMLTAILILVLYGTGCNLAKHKAGAISAVSFNGPISGTSVKYNIYLPPDYYSSDKQYAVIYHLHGLGGDESSDNDIVVEGHKSAVAEGIVDPMIIVFPNGMNNSMWADSKDGKKPVETNVIKEMIPHIDATYRTHAEADYRVIQGFSMGGYGATLYAAKYPDLFGMCINYDGALHDIESLSTKRQAIFKEIFNEDTTYFKRYSPWTHVDEKRDVVHEKVTMRMVVGALSEFNKKYYSWLIEVDVIPEYVPTECGHDLECLIGNGWKNDYYFIADHLGGGGETAPLIAGRVNYRVFKGPVTDRNVKYNIYLPPDYFENQREYAVIYHLHGLSVNHEAHKDLLSQSLESAVEAGIIEPMIIVHPNGYRDAWWSDRKDGTKPAETNVIKELIPHIDATYRTKQIVSTA
jgi:enterochelin esterase-like enzyme